LPHFTASLEKLFSLVNHVKTNKNLPKMKKNAKQALPRSQQRGYYIACLSLKGGRCQKWRMLSALLVHIKCFE